MPYLQRYAPGSRQIASGGDAPASPVADAAPTPAQPSQPQGSGFTGLSDYLAANGDAAHAMAQRIIAPVDQEARGAAYAGKVYAGNGQWKSQDPTALNAQRAAVRPKLDALGTPAGISAFLGQQNPQATQGENRLNASLLGATAGDDITALRAKYQGLLDPLAQPAPAVPGTPHPVGPAPAVKPAPVAPGSTVDTKANPDAYPAPKVSPVDSLDTKSSSLRRRGGW